MIKCNQPVRPAREVVGQELEDLIESMGGHEAVRESFLRHEERYNRFNSRWDEFASKYPGQFVALTADDTVLVSETLQGIIAEIDGRGFRRRDCVMKYIQAESEMWLL